MVDLQKQIEELENKIIELSQALTEEYDKSYTRELKDEKRCKELDEIIINVKNLIEENKQLKKLLGWKSKDILPEKEITHAILFDGGVPFQACLIDGIWFRMPKNTPQEAVEDFTYWKPLDLPPHLIKGESNDR